MTDSVNMYTIGENWLSKRATCHEIMLDWVHNFAALGIKYIVRRLQEMTILNYNTKMADFEKILLCWVRRNTSLAGIELAIKNLALSKLIPFLLHYHHH